MLEKKTGILRSWHDERGFGVIQVGPPLSQDRYFLHVSQIRTGTATPTVGMVVTFSVSPKPVKEGNLPAAIDADVDMASVAPVAVVQS
jgi:cold shock CspA family protein